MIKEFYQAKTGRIGHADRDLYSFMQKHCYKWVQGNAFFHTIAAPRYRCK